MKKLTALALSFFFATTVFFTAALPASAQISGNICPVNPTADSAMNFNPLCSLFVRSDNLIGNIINIAFVVAVLIALAFLIYGGVKWIMSGGDKSAVEGARNMIVAALVGLVITFLSYFILQIVFQLFGLDFASGNFWASFTLFGTP